MKDSIYNLEHLKHLLDNLDSAFTEREIIFNEKGEPIDYRFVYANETYCKLINTTPKELIGKTAIEVFPGEHDHWLDEFYEVVKTGKPMKVPRYVTRIDRHFFVYAYKSGEKRFAVNFRDITSILRSADEYNISKPDVTLMKDVSKIGFFEVNRLTFKADVSDVFNEVVGLDVIEEGFFRKTLLELTHRDDYEKIKQLIIDVVNGDLTELETEFKMLNKKHNYYHWMSFFVFAIEYDESGKPFRYTGMVRDIEEEKMRLEEQKEHEDLFKEARRVADLTTFIFDVKKSQFEPSLELDEFLGIENLETIDQFRKIVHPEDLEDYDIATRYTLDNGQDKITVYRIIKDNELKYIQSSVFAKSDVDGNAIKVFGILKDITNFEAQRQIAEKSRRSFELIFNSSPAGIFILDSELEISMENLSFREYLKAKPGDIKLRTLLGEYYDNAIESLKKGNDVKHLRVSYEVDSKTKYFVINMSKISEEFTNDYEGTLVDITQQVADEERILYLATHDVLTTLYNRNYFEEIVVEKKNNYPLGLVLCDIDGLKLINDAFGHLRGDELLQSLALTLKTLSPKYIAARTGGDEFAVIVDNADEEMLEKIELEIKESIKDLGLFGIDFEVSLGHAIMNEENTDFNRVFNIAENMMYRRKLTDRSSRKSNALTTIMQTLHEKTEETLNHCERVGDYSSMLLSESGFKRTVDLEDIRFLSDVHDIGKIAIPEGILSKASSLTKEEYEQIQYHSEAGYKIIKNIIDNENIAFGILYHHERYDGKGYPHGLAGDQIPLYARVLAITDSYDTMIRGRIYQKPITSEAALKEIELNKGTQFDPELSDTFIKIIREKND